MRGHRGRTFVGQTVELRKLLLEFLRPRDCHRVKLRASLVEPGNRFDGLMLLRRLTVRRRLLREATLRITRLRRTVALHAVGMFGQRSAELLAAGLPGIELLGFL